ncbi:MAG: hypothetical protein GY799_29475 [Desulfobulbaceae bacterium]|nr:hypothetical protein [Desulfobulbaceae bacterium]
MNPLLKNLAMLIEDIASKYDVHVALTGGQLYKDGPRKDIDFVLYHSSRKCMAEYVEADNLKAIEDIFLSLYAEGFSNFRNFGRVTKCTYNGVAIDFLYPEYQHQGEYNPDNNSWDEEKGCYADYNIYFPALKDLS